MFWLAFFVLVSVFLALDLGVFNRKPHEINLGEAAISSAVWVGIALAFGAGVFAFLGFNPGMEFFTCYIAEKALSLDNLTVFVLIFSYFGVKSDCQHRVLFWGVIGAIAMRAILITTGTLLISCLHWLTYLLGAFVLYSAYKMWNTSNDAIKLNKGSNKIASSLHRLFPVSDQYHGHHFFVRESNSKTGGFRLMATRLFIVLVTLELMDLMFAADSVPMILSISNDPFVLITSNTFAILGLRALYFLLSALMPLLSQLRKGITIVLFFVGAKMLTGDIYHVPIIFSLTFVALILAGSVLASLTPYLHRYVRQHLRNSAPKKTLLVSKQAFQPLQLPRPAHGLEHRSEPEVKAIDSLIRPFP